MLGQDGSGKPIQRGLANGLASPPLGGIPHLSSQPRSIAIVGMAVEFPRAEGSEALWEVLQDGLNTVDQIPSTRFDVSAHTHSPDSAGRQMNVKMGNFLDYPDTFDNAFFDVSPREARSMDPQQRVLLRLGHHALENAGYSPGTTPSFNPDTFATFIGAATNDYVQNLRHEIDVYYSTGTLPAFLSGRLSYAFAFGGPSMVLDTACSSSIVAIHQACRALVARDCNAALAGGVNIITSPDMYLGLARGHFLSETGQCRPWDASADGYCRSEGCGLFVLKRLDDALAENDRILAVIRGIEVNQSGNASSITHPHVDAQTALFQKLISSARIDPHDVSVVECHGTGTQAGDPAELEAVRRVLAIGRQKGNALHITSIKANIGHAEAASGAASLAKLILMMRHQSIPRHISFERLNPRIPDLSIDNVRIDTVQVPWVCPEDGKRLAMLTNFGAAGSNSALILEEHVSSPRHNPVPGELIIGFSCKSLAALGQRREAYLADLQRVQDHASLQDFVYSATARRQLYPYRLAASGSSKEELVAGLRLARVVQAHPRQKVVFVFSGQGSQYLGMGNALYKRIPMFARVVNECHRMLVDLGSPGVLAIFHGSLAPAVGNEAVQFRSYQAALFVLEYALAQLWMSWGVRPCAVVGHSFGEFAALVVAGSLTLADALRLVTVRAEAISASSVLERTGMTSVRGSVDAFASCIGVGPFSHLEVCCNNSDSNFVIGGPLDELNRFEQRLAAIDVLYTRLTVPYAYHSAAMDSAVPPLHAFSRSIKLSAPTVPVLSNVTGTLIQPGDATPFDDAYFARHCREPARFQQGMADLATQIDLSSVAACIEMGPHPTTLPLLRGYQTDDTPLLLPCLRRNTQGLETMWATLAKLYCTSVPVQWRKVFDDLTPGARLVDLPAYPFAQTRLWVPYVEERSASAPQQTHSSRNIVSRPGLEFWTACETDLSSLAHFIEGHMVAGFPLCPASVYAELALSAISSAYNDTSLWSKDVPLDLEEVVYSAPLVYSPGSSHRLRVEVARNVSDHRSGSFTVSRTAEGGVGEVVYCKGDFILNTVEARSAEFARVSARVKGEIQDVLRGSFSMQETFNTRTIYDMLFPSIVVYSPVYRVIKTITVNASSPGAYAVVQLPVNPPSGPYTVHPIFLDALFHVAGFLVNFLRGMNDRDAYICSRGEKIQFLPQALDLNARYGVYADVTREKEDVVTVDVYALKLDDPHECILARLEKVQFRRVGLSGFAQALQDAAGEEVLVPQAENVLPAPAACSTPVSRAPLPIKHTTRDLERNVLLVIAEAACLPQESVRLDARLSHLGIDSLMLWEVAAQLRATIPAFAPGIDARTLSCATTVRELVDLVVIRCHERHADRSSVREEDDGLTLCVDDPDEAPKSSMLCRGVDESMPKSASVKDRDTLPSDALGGPVQLSTTDSYSIYDHSASASDVLSPSPSLYATYPSAFGAELVRLQRAPAGSPSKPPLVLIHDGSGTISSYAGLAPLGRDVWAFRNHDFSKLTARERPAGTQLHALALSYLVTLLEEFKWFKESTGTSGGECYIGGWSFGGVVAYELARLMDVFGIRVKGILLIDAPAPQTREPLPGWLIYEVAKRLTAATGDYDGALYGAGDDTGRAGREDATYWIVEQMKIATRALVSYNRVPTVEPPRLCAVYLRASEGADVMSSAGKEEELDVRVRAFLTKEGDEWTLPLWEEALGGGKMVVMDVPGDHFTMFGREKIQELSRVLEEALELLS
ncbi:ketoacyl-synt-domain-containing protein [Trametes cingulata]|nr:ketoacyl-synt-domain-containing protein [Trametes cingulata]